MHKLICYIPVLQADIFICFVFIFKNTASYIHYLKIQLYQIFPWLNQDCDPVSQLPTLYNEENTRQDLFARQRIFNGIDDYAEDKNLRYYNLFYEMEGIGLNGETDYMDSQHFNASGQTKVTRYMAEMGYLSPEA